MGQTTFHLWPKMKLLNQRCSLQRIMPKGLAGTAGIDGNVSYVANDTCCAPIAAAMALRSVIEHSALRFDALKPTSQLKPGGAASITLAVPDAVVDSDAIDFYDVELMTYLCRFMGYLNASDESVVPPPPTRDGNQSSGLGTLAGMSKQFVTSVGAAGRNLAARPVPVIGGALFRSYPVLNAQRLAEWLDAGFHVVLGFKWAQPRLKNGDFELDSHGNKMWVDKDVEHALTVNGYGDHASAGRLFRVYDPFGINPRTDGARAIGLKVFAGLEHGLIEYVKLANEQVETVFYETANSGATVAVTSIADDADHAHPTWLYNPFITGGVGKDFLGRVLTSITTLRLGSGVEPLANFVIEDEALVGPGIVDPSKYSLPLSGTWTQHEVPSPPKPADKPPHGGGVMHVPRKG